MNFQYYNIFLISLCLLRMFFFYLMQMIKKSMKIHNVNLNDDRMRAKMYRIHQIHQMLFGLIVPCAIQFASIPLPFYSDTTFWRIAFIFMPTLTGRAFTWFDDERINRLCSSKDSLFGDNLEDTPFNWINGRPVNSKTIFNVIKRASVTWKFIDILSLIRVSSIGLSNCK